MYLYSSVISKPNVHIHIEFTCRNLIGHTVGPTRAKYISIQEFQSGFESVPGIVGGSKLGGFLYQVWPHLGQIWLNKCRNPDQIWQPDLCGSTSQPVCVNSWGVKKAFPGGKLFLDERGPLFYNLKTGVLQYLQMARYCMYVSFIGLRLNKTSLTLINRTRLTYL